MLLSLLPTRSRITYKNFNIDSTYSSIKIKLVQVNCIKSKVIPLQAVFGPEGG